MVIGLWHSSFLLQRLYVGDVLSDALPEGPEIFSEIEKKVLFVYIFFPFCIISLNYRYNISL